MDNGNRRQWTMATGDGGQGKTGVVDGGKQWQTGVVGGGIRGQIGVVSGRRVRRTRADGGSQQWLAMVVNAGRW